MRMHFDHRKYRVRVVGLSSTYLRPYITVIEVSLEIVEGPCSGAMLRDSFVLEARNDRIRLGELLEVVGHHPYDLDEITEESEIGKILVVDIVIVDRKQVSYQYHPDNNR